MTTTLAEQTASPPRPQHVDPETLSVVREQVQSLLKSSPAWRELPLEQRNQIANQMVTVGNYIANGEGTRPTTERALVAAPPTVGFDPGTTAGADFTDAAASKGTQDLASEVQAVNFPGFVASLIQGTFGAIVTASIQQMNAYGELLKNVTKSVEEYMRDNVSTNNARDYLAQQYPDHLQVDTSGDQPKLTPTPAANDGTAPMPDFMKDLGLPQPVDSLDNDTVEQQLVPAARQRMALDRQHLLATMVLMGINRLVVTDGTINAKVLFQLSTVDKVKKSATQDVKFSDSDRKSTSSGGFWWFSPTETERETTNLNVSTSKSDSSQAEIDLHTNLSGEVNVRFKSETFPLDKMADIIGVDKIGNTQVGTGQNLQSMPAGNRQAPPPLNPDGTPATPTTPPATPPATTPPATTPPAPAPAAR
ncbi:MAG TPA: hypothetical protein VHS03_02635 [Gaiellaceae bacterium]|jgi:hypothetical protein|nr:hypothetical protein [Gaiellaceae bacterium]